MAKRLRDLKRLRKLLDEAEELKEKYGLDDEDPLELDRQIKRIKTGKDYKPIQEVSNKIQQDQEAKRKHYMQYSGDYLFGDNVEDLPIKEQEVVNEYMGADIVRNTKKYMIDDKLFFKNQIDQSNKYGGHFGERNLLYDVVIFRLEKQYGKLERKAKIITHPDHVRKLEYSEGIKKPTCFDLGKSYDCKVPVKEMKEEDIIALGVAIINKERKELDYEDQFILMAVSCDLLIWKEVDIHKYKVKAVHCIEDACIDDSNGRSFEIIERCFPEFLFRVMHGHPRLTRYDLDTITKMLNEINPNGAEAGYTIDDALEFQKGVKYISLIGFDPFYNKIFDFRIKNTKDNRATGVFLFNNNHVQGIYNQQVLRKILMGGCDKLKLNDYTIDKKVYDNYMFIDDNNYNDIIAGKEDEAEVYLVDPMRYDIRDLLYDCVDNSSKYRNEYQYRKMRNGSEYISMFIHPISKKPIMLDDSFLLRKKICQILEKRLSLDLFDFKNQSTSVIISDLFDCIVGYIEKSTFPKEMRDTMDSCECGPRGLIQTLTTDFYSDDGLRLNTKAIDISKCYTSVCLFNQFRYAVFSCEDEIMDYHGEEITCAKYFITGDIDLPFHYRNKSGRINKLYLKNKTWYCENIVSYLLEHHYITKKDISKWCKPQKYYDADLFVKLIHWINDNIKSKDKEKEEQMKKLLFNTLTGTFGHMVNRL